MMATKYVDRAEDMLSSNNNKLTNGNDNKPCKQ